MEVVVRPLCSTYANSDNAICSKYIHVRMYECMYECMPPFLLRNSVGPNNIWACRVHHQSECTCIHTYVHTVYYVYALLLMCNYNCDWKPSILHAFTQMAVKL